MSALALEHLSKQYGKVAAVRDVSLSLESGGTLALLGPSGCGKSTLLRLIAGLEAPDAGRVCLNGADVTKWAPERRDLSLVFQDYALFPHLSVLGNVAYGPRARGLDKRAADVRAREALALVGLEALAARRVTELSGGQQQRVALARSLAPRPKLLLLDEPLSNLDERLRAELQGELRALFTRLGVTTLLVTHDQREALSLAGTLALMRAGRLVQLGPADLVRASPVSAWAAAFLGHRNLLPRGAETLLVPEEAVKLGEGPAYPVTGRRADGVGTLIEVAHDLGPLTLALSPREAELAKDTLRLTVDRARCRLLPSDLEGERG